MAIASALARARTPGGWGTKPDDLDAVADFRALLVAGAMVGQWLKAGGQSTLPITGTGVGPLTPAEPLDFADVNRMTLAQMPARIGDAIFASASRADPEFQRGLDQNFVTLEGSPPVAVTTTPGVSVGGWPAAVVAIVGITGIIYLGDRALRIYNDHLIRTDAIAKSTAALGRAVEAAKNHIDAEAAAGKPLPLNQVEVDLIKSVQADVDANTKAFGAAAQPLPSIFPDTDKVVGKTLEVAGDTTTSLGLIAAGAVVVLGGMFLAMGGGKAA